MIGRPSRERLDLTLRRLVGDTADGVAPTLDWMAHEDWMVKERTSRRTCRSATRGRAETTRSRLRSSTGTTRTIVPLPKGHVLRSHRRQLKNPRDHVTKAGTIIYRSSAGDCVHCATKQRCCPNAPICKIARSIYEEVARRRRAFDRECARSRRDRKEVEMLFAHLKRFLKPDRLGCAALQKHRTSSCSQNLRRMSKWLMPKTEAAGA